MVGRWLILALVGFLTCYPALADPPVAGYQLKAEREQALGYAGYDASGHFFSGHLTPPLIEEGLGYYPLNPANNFDEILNPDAARANIGAAALGDPLAGFVGPLSTAQGGTGLASPGTVGNVLCSNGTIWISANCGGGGGGGGTPGGGDGYVQLNSGGLFAGDSGLTYNLSSHTLTVANLTLNNPLPASSMSGANIDMALGYAPAHPGANSDITSLTGLTAPLSVGSGGTGATASAAARSNLAAAGSGANTDITSLTGLTTPLPLTEGGTGSTTESGARVSLGAAARGANSDITSLTGLTTPLALAEGGTGSTTAAGARAVLGAAARGANSDITSLAGLTTPLPLTEGGTGSTTAAGARTALSAAVSGVNGDISSLTGLTTPLATSEGGTGLASPGTSGNVLCSNGTGWVSSSCGIVGGGVLAANNATDFASPATSLTNLGGTGPLNLSGFWDAGGVYHSIVCDGTTDQSAIVKLAEATGRDIYGPSAAQPCVFGDVALTHKQGFFGYGMQVKAPPGARWVLSRQSTGIVAGMSGVADTSPGEEAITTTSGNSAVGSNTVQAAPEATSSAATGSGTSLTLGGAIAGTFVRNMTICDGGSTVLCATGLGYVVGNVLHITSTTQGQYAVGQLIETYTATPVTSITASLTTASGDVSTWQLNQSIGNIASQGSPQSVFAAMTVSSISGSVLAVSGNVGTLGATAISGTRLELGERAAVQMSDGYRHNAFIYGLAQTASQVSLTLARNLPQTVVSGSTVWASWGMFNAGCNAQNATFRDISFQASAWTGIYNGCTDNTSLVPTVTLEGIQAGQGLRHFFIIFGPRVGPALATDVRINEAWSKSYTLTGDGSAGPYQLKEPANQRTGAGGPSGVTSGAVTFTSVQSWQVLGATNFYIDEDTYHIWFGQTIPNGQTINITQNNLPGDEGVIVDASYGPLQLTGRANAFNISGHGGGCQVCLGVYNQVGTSPIAGIIRSWFGDPASEAMIRLDGPMQIDVQTGRLSNTTRAVVEIINKAVVTGNIVVNPQPTTGNTLSATEQPFVFDPLAKFFGTWRSLSRPAVNFYGSQFQFYAGLAPKLATNGLCTTTDVVPLGAYDIPCSPDDTFTGYLSNNALTVLTGGTNLAVGMQINAKNHGVPNSGVTINSINGGGSVTLEGGASLGTIGSSGSPVSFTATTLLPGQLHVPSTAVSGYSVNNAFTITSGGGALIAGMTLNGPGYPVNSVTILSVNGGGTLTLSGAGTLGSVGSSGSPIDFAGTYLSKGQTANSPSTNYVTTPFLPSWATIINYDGAVLHLTSRATGDGPSGIPLGSKLQFSGPIQPSGSFGSPALAPYGDAAGNILYSSDITGPASAMFNTQRQWLNSSGIVASPTQGIPTGSSWDNNKSTLSSPNLSIIQGAAHGVGVGGVAAFFGQNSANNASVAQGAFGCNWEQSGTNDAACGIYTRKQGGTPALSLGVSSGGLISFPRTAGTFSTKPSAASAPYTYYYASDLGPNGCMLLSNGTIWAPANGRCKIYHSNTPTTPTSSTAEVNALFATIPAGIPSANGTVEVVENGVGTGTAGVKALSIRLGSGTSPITTGGCQILNYQPSAANNSLIVKRSVWAQGSTSSQAAGGVDLPGPGASSTTVNCTITTSAAWGISFNNLVGNSGDTISIADASVYWEE